MDFFSSYAVVADFLDSSTFTALAAGSAIYLGVLWLALVIWVARDIVHRTNNLLFQVISILLGFAFLPGVLLYLIIRPARTLTEKYDEELERRAFLESIPETEEDCRNCGLARRKEFVFCPECGEKLRHRCKCGAVLEEGWNVCPECGEKILPPEEKKERRGGKKKKEG